MSEIFLVSPYRIDIVPHSSEISKTFLNFGPYRQVDHAPAHQAHQADTVEGSKPRF